MSEHRKIILWAGLASSLVFSMAVFQGPAAPPETVARIVQLNCAVADCHAGQFPAGALNLEPGKVIASTVNVASLEKPEFKIVNRDAPDKSYLLKKIRGDRGIAGRRMPLGRDPLKKEEIAAIEAWLKSLKPAY